MKAALPAALLLALSSALAAESAPGTVTAALPSEQAAGPALGTDSSGPAGGQAPLADGPLADGSRPAAFCRQAKPAAEGAGLPVKSHIAEEVHDIPIPAGVAAVDREIAEYSSPDGVAWVQAILRRARPWQDSIQEAIASYGLPEELFYLPVVESEYTVNNVSRSGAAGLWQFMMNSIRGMGMKVDEWRDDRRDFQKSTDAALRKLSDNYREFGDWYLALAAYNCGNGAMERAIRKAGTRDYWELCQKKALPRETREYVPKFLAIAAVARYVGRRGGEASWPDPVDWEKVELGRPVDITIIADRAGLKVSDLKTGNPELRYNVTPPDSSYGLKVPAGAADRVRSILSDPSLPLIKYHIYTIHAGDTLSALARHYGVSVAMIVSNNPGLKPSALRIGARVLIPALKDVEPYQGSKPVDTGVAFAGSYTVRKGDTLWSIALKHQVGPELLAERNGLELSSIIHEGAVLKVPIIN